MNAHSLLELSCSEEIFSKATPEYKQSLRNSGFGENINHLSHSATYAPKNRKKKKQSRNIICFNPPLSDSVTTNIGKEFFLRLAKHFPLSNRLRKIINKQNFKLSYSFLANIK